MNESYALSKRLRGVLHALRLRGPLAGDPTARILHVFLLSLAVWEGIWTAILLPLYPIPPARWGGAAQIFVPLVSLVLLRRGFLKPASVFYLAFTWIFATYNVAFNGGIYSPVLAYYVAVPIIAAWLIGFRGALWSIIACASTALVFALMDVIGIDLPRPHATPFGIWAVLMQVALSGAIPVAQILRKLREESIERQRREQELCESEERFRRVFEEGPLGVGLVGKDYHFAKVNSALCRMVGYSEAELVQKSFVDITHPDDVQADMELAERLFTGEKPFYKLQKRYVKKNGEIVWINLTASLIRDKEGNPIHGLAMIEDITEMKRAQEEALARQKLESVGVLAGGIAHDFNNLLGSIVASTELALKERADGVDIDEELQRIKTTAIRGAEIVRELMIYGGEETPTLELVDISALVNEILELLKVSISKHTILKIELGQDLPPVQANPAQIRQVVMNLITNASEAIGERSGEIRVTSGKVKVGPDSSAPSDRDLAEGDYLRLEVFDTGRGMTPDVRARIFDPFFSTKRAGRGLGLAAVQGVIRSHGGMINVESAPGQGSRFEILLPCFDQATQKKKDITVTPSAPEPGTITGTVLVVEDEATLRVAVSKMLRKSGFSVIEAGDGTTGVNLFRANERKIDVVLLDMTLPGMSGPDVLEELRRIQPGVKVILTTAFSQASTLSSIAEQHLWGFVRKPYQLSELTSLLQKACLDEPKITGHSAG